MPAWEEIQINAKKLIDEGMKMLRSGMHEASFLADITAKSANLHVSLRRNHSERYKTVHEIGKLVCDAAIKDPSRGEIKLTDDVRKKMKKVVDLDQEAADFEKEIAKLTVTSKTKPAKKKAAKK